MSLIRVYFMKSARNYPQQYNHKIILSQTLLHVHPTSTNILCSGIYIMKVCLGEEGDLMSSNNRKRHLRKHFHIFQKGKYSHDRYMGLGLLHCTENNGQDGDMCKGSRVSLKDLPRCSFAGHKSRTNWLRTELESKKRDACALATRPLHSLCRADWRKREI